MHEKDTGELFSELREDEDIRGFLARNKGEFVRPLHEYLEELLREKHLKKLEVIRAAGLERAYGYHIFAGSKPKPSRTKLLPIALAMGLDLEETQKLLRYAGESMLYPRNPWDSVIISAIGQGLSVKEANALLSQLGETKFLG